ncbi:MAG: M48 family metalloprotease [Gallionellaceae bacterium]|nr:M48 family metalloprotease [Gallionellaceae bacterium]
MMAEQPSPLVLVKDKPNGKVVAGVKTQDIRNMIGIKDRVEAAAGEMRTDLLVADGDEPNGFSFIYHDKPRIAINIPMINLIGEDEDAMAALIGHELAHLYLEHGKKQVKREENLVVTSTIISLALGLAGIPMGPSDLATTTLSRKYSREDEREADAEGVKYMLLAGFSPCGATRLQEKLGAISPGTLIPFMSTHPSNSERAENMKVFANCSKAANEAKAPSEIQPDSSIPVKSFAPGE